MDTARVFKSGNSQAVRIPKEYVLNDKEYYIQKIGNVLILKPVSDPWKGLRDSLSKFTDDIFDDGRNQPQDVDVREGL